MRSACDGCLKQRTCHSLLDCLQRLVVAASLSDTDVGDSLVGHNCLDIREVKVDKRRYVDQVCDALDTLLQNLVRLLQGFRHGSASVYHLKQFISRTQLYSEKISLFPETCDIPTLLRNLAEECNTCAEKRGSVRVAECDTQPLVCDPAHIEEVLRNLIANGLDAAGKNGQVTLSYRNLSRKHGAVIWAVDKGITGGTSATTFSPNGICTRAQAVTFLWRAAGSPAPKSSAMPFTDVPAGSWYYDAVLWAVEQGITAGTSATTFAPDLNCSRAQIVTFLYRAAGSPAVSGSPAFSDVAPDAYYAKAVKWAQANGITSGIGGGLFGSNDNCTRAQIVTFIYRYMEK